MTHVGGLDVLALALGLAVCIVSALLVSPLGRQSDPDMIWEARAAVGFAALAYVGPLWLGQAASTLFATLNDGGIWSGWLWGWLVAAPLVGVSPPAAALARGSLSIFRRGSAGPDLHLSGAAVQQASNFAWADTIAEPGWELRRVPPLPLQWPPTLGGAAVWFCYAERPATAETIEVAAAPIVERLSDAVESMGHKALSPPQVASSARSCSRSYVLATRTVCWPGALNDWRVRNALIAAAPSVAPHLPPVL